METFAYSNGFVEHQSKCFISNAGRQRCRNSLRVATRRTTRMKKDNDCLAISRFRTSRSYGSDNWCRLCIWSTSGHGRELEMTLSNSKWQTARVFFATRTLFCKDFFLLYYFPYAMAHKPQLRDWRVCFSDSRIFWLWKGWYVGR